MSLAVRLATAAVIGAVALGGGSLLINRLMQHDVGSSPSPSITSASDAPTPPAIATQPWVLFELGGTVTAPHEIWLAHLDGTEAHELSPDNPDGKAAFDISPDGTRVVFTSVEGDSSRFRLWEVDIDGGSPRLLTTGCSGEWNDCAEINPAYSPDGRRVAFVRMGFEETAAIGIRDLASGEVMLLEATRTPDAVTGHEGVLSRPTWSPDGRRLAYSQWFYSQFVPGPQAHLYVVADDGTAHVDLELEVAATNPVWSPDGSTLVFEGEGSVRVPPQPSSIYTVLPDGSDMRVLVAGGWGTGEPGGFGPSWTRDGSRILYWDQALQTWLLLDPQSLAKEPLIAGALPIDASRPVVARLQPLP